MTHLLTPGWSLLVDIVITRCWRTRTTNISWVIECVDLVLRKWLLLGLIELHSASTREGQRGRERESERTRGSQGCETTLCPQGFGSILPGCWGSAPVTPLHRNQHQVQVLRASLYGGLRQCCPTCLTPYLSDPAGPHFPNNFLPENPRVLPKLWTGGSGLGLGPSPSCLQAAACHPWVDGTQWPDCRKSADWGQFPSLPELATVPVR